MRTEAEVAHAATCLSTTPLLLCEAFSDLLPAPQVAVGPLLDERIHVHSHCQEFVLRTAGSNASLHDIVL